MTGLQTALAKPLAAGLVAAAALVACAGCGSSQPKVASAPSATVSATTGRSGPFAGPGRFAAVRSCLEREGLRLPRPPAGGPFGGFRGGGSPPAGLSRSQLEADLRRCGVEPRHRRAGAASFLHNPQVVAALEAFAACMRAHGIDLPKPNTSGSGEIFNAKGLNTASPAFRTAYLACREKLPFGFHQRAEGGS